MTTDQAKVLNVMRNHGGGSLGLLTWRIAALCDKPVYYANPKLKALAKMGFVVRDVFNDERWYLTDAGRA